MNAVNSGSAELKHTVEWSPSIKRLRSPFAESQRAVSIVLTCFKQSLWERKPLK